ncbi:MAG: pteridine reductase [Steroidobacteraceae bacterium]|nr:pteridine reductase [Steroidobacteraceae bacterium]
MQTAGPLAGRCVLVTGGAKRLGAAIARRCHEAGANLVVHYHRSRPSADALVADLNSARAASAVTACADLNDVACLPGLVAAALDEFGRLDVLVNNASTFYPTPVGTISLSQFDDLVGTNLRAPLFLSQAAAPALRATQGLVLNMVDIHGRRPLKAHPVYSAAKAGLVMLTMSLARELGPEIRVNGIAPGPVLWPERDLDPALKDEIIAKTALKRSGSPDDIARTALYLATEAPYVTGQVITVDGGRSL